MKKVIITSAFALMVVMGANAQKWVGVQDLSVPMIQAPFIENPDIALPDFESEVKEPKAETAKKSDAVMNEDKDRKKKKKQ